MRPGRAASFAVLLLFPVALGAAGGGGLSEISDVGGSVLLRGAFVVLVVTSAWLAYVALTYLPKLSGVARP